MTYPPTYPPGSPQESCPAATGMPDPAMVAEDPSLGCGIYRDRAHRCRDDRLPAHYRHRCLCGFEWSCTIVASDLTDAQIRMLMHRPRHAA